VLPALPAILLALTSPAAAVYVLNKAVASNTPSVSSVNPSTAKVGDPIAVEGSNLRPDGTGPPTVTIGGVDGYPEPIVDHSEVVRARRRGQARLF
jgi:hypothetical protein